MACTELPRNSVFDKRLDIGQFSKNIPGYLSRSDIIVLNALLEPYANVDTIGIEVGSLHGKSSYTIAKTINPGILYCIDPWDNFESYDTAYEKIIEFTNFPKKGTKNSLEFFLDNVQECKNILAIQGHSPQSVLQWNKPIDFIFLDGLHQNPNDRENIDFWITKIKKGGLFIGHDYYTNGSYLDIKENIKYLEHRLNKRARTFKRSSIWSFQIN